MIRDPVYAGQFYPGTRDRLKRELEALVKFSDNKSDAVGVVSPHAGYVYSGTVAGVVFGNIRPKPVYIILGPNHTGMGDTFGIDTSDSWKTPLGEAVIDKRLAGALIKNSKSLTLDSLSHSHEHSIEVQLPFLQYMQKAVRFVPITVAQADPGAYEEVGRSIAEAVRQLKLERDVLIIASSDMTHYETQKSAETKDRAAIDAVLSMDASKLIREVARLDISMCGYAPAAIMMTAARLLGAKRARLAAYRTSGEVTGDYSSVVGYAGIIIT